MRKVIETLKFPYLFVVVDIVCAPYHVIKQYLVCNLTVWTQNDQVHTLYNQLGILSSAWNIVRENKKWLYHEWKHN